MSEISLFIILDFIKSILLETSEIKSNDHYEEEVKKKESENELRMNPELGISSVP